MPKCNNCGNTSKFEGTCLSLKNVKAEFNDFGDMIDIDVEHIEETILTRLDGLAFEKCSVCGSENIQLEDLYEALDDSGRFHLDKSKRDTKEMIH
jgi:hypothetical protein